MNMEQFSQAEIIVRKIRTVEEQIERLEAIRSGLSKHNKEISLVHASNVLWIYGGKQQRAILDAVKEVLTAELKQLNAQLSELK